MRNSRSTDSRLRQLEGERGQTTMVLRFEDGSSRGVRISRDNRLPLLIAAFDFALAHPPKGPDGEIVDAPPRQPRDAMYTPVLNLMANAESIKGDRTMQTIHGLVKKERKAT